MEVLCWEVYCYLFLYEKLSSVEWFKTIHIYYLTVSVGQIFGHNFPGSSASGFPTSCNRSISQGWGFIWRLSRVKICFIGRIQFQKGCQTEDPSSFHAVRLTVLLPHWLLASSVQSLSHVQLFATAWITACQASLSITSSRSLPKPMSIESVIAIQPSHPLSSPFLPALNLSQHQGLFKWVSSSHQVAKVLEFQPQH